MPSFRAVPSDLRIHAEGIWTYANASPGWRSEIHPADDATNLVVQLGASGAPRVYLCGPEPSRRPLASPPGAVCVGVRLRPGSVPVLFGVEGRALTGGHLLLDAVAPRDHRSLVERASDDPEEVARALVHLLRIRVRLARRSSVLERVGAAVALLSEPFTPSLDDVVRALGTSPRTLRREFGALVGLGPKRFARVVRLREAARRLASSANLATLALECGFSDQAHMTREFVALIGVAPRALRHADLPFVPGTNRSVVA